MVEGGNFKPLPADHEKRVLRPGCGHVKEAAICCLTFGRKVLQPVLIEVGDTDVIELKTFDAMHGGES